MTELKQVSEIITDDQKQTILKIDLKNLSSEEKENIFKQLVKGVILFRTSKIVILKNIDYINIHNLNEPIILNSSLKSFLIKLKELFFKNETAFLELIISKNIIKLDIKFINTEENFYTTILSFPYSIFNNESDVISKEAFFSLFNNLNDLDFSKQDEINNWLNIKYE